MMLSHQILVLKPTAGCVLRHWAARLKQHLLLRIRMCRMCLKRCHNLDSTHRRPPAGCCVFFPHLAVFWRLPATLAGYQPSFGGPVVFRYFSWLVKFIHGWLSLAGDKLIFSPVLGVLEFSEDLTVTTYQQPGLTGLIFGASLCQMLPGMNVLKLNQDFSFISANDLQL